MQETNFQIALQRLQKDELCDEDVLIDSLEYMTDVLSYTDVTLTEPAVLLQVCLVQATNRYPHVRRKSIILIVHLAKIHPLEGTDAISILIPFLEDEASVVRQCVVLSLFELHSLKSVLLPIHYEPLKLVLQDSSSEVRMLGVRLIWLLVSTFPDTKLTGNSSHRGLFLADDAFIRLCDLLNDSSTQVCATSHS
jgi:hypothetical protein